MEPRKQIYVNKSIMYIKLSIPFIFSLYIFFSCASHRLWNKPELFIKKLYFDDNGRFVIIASNFSRVEICNMIQICSSENIGSFFVESKITLTSDEILMIIFYDISGRRKVRIEADMKERKVGEIFWY